MFRSALLLAALAAASANVKVTPASDTSLKASWTVPPSDGGAAITKYKIQFSASPVFSASATFEKEVTNSATQYTLGVNEGVQAGVKYYVRVMAYNSEGFSDPCANTGPICSSTAPVASTTTT